MTNDEPVRRWVEGVVTAKLVDRRMVHLQSAEYDRVEFRVPDPEVWNEITVGTMGIAETDAGQLLGWRSLRPSGD